MSKFKKGDKVRILDDGLISTLYKVGEIATVFADSDDILVTLTMKDGLTQLTRINHVEIIHTLKVDCVFDDLFEEAEERVKYREPAHITKIREETKVLIQMSQSLKKKVKTFSRPSSTSKSLSAIASRELNKNRILLNAYHVILRQHNEMKKMFARARESDRHVKMLYGLET